MAGICSAHKGFNGQCRLCLFSAWRNAEAERDAAMAQVAVLAEYCHDMVNPSGIVNTTALANDLAHLPAAANRLLAEAAIGRKAIECHSPTQWEGSDHFPGLSDALEAWRQAE